MNKNHIYLSLFLVWNC